MAYNLTAHLRLNDVNFTRQMRSANLSMASLSNGAIGLATQLGIVVSAVGAVGAAFTSVNKAMDFEAQMSSIKALTGATGSEMAEIQKLALDMGAKTKYSALEAGQGIEELLKAGLTPATVQAGGLEAALNLATAGGLDLASAAEIMSTALNAYKSDGMKAADASNILAGTANASATGVTDLQQSLAAVSAVAAGVGMSFKDTNIALGLFANSGLKGSDAGTSLKTMLSNLQPTTKGQIELFKKLGLTAKDGTNQFFTAEGKLKSLKDISGLLTKSMGGLTDQQRMLAMETLFGSDAIRAANILYEKGAGGVTKFNEEMSKVTALDVAKGKMDNAKGAVEQFQGALETFQIAALTPLMPLIKESALGLADWLGSIKPEQIKAWGDSIKESAQKVLDFAIAVKDNWVPIRETVIALGVAVLSFKGIMLGLAIVGTVTKMMNAYKTTVVGATTVQALFNGVLLANPMGLVVVGIAALIAAGVALYRNWETVEKVMSKVWDNIKKAAEVSLNFIIGGINKLIKLINKIPGVNIPIVPKVDWTGVKSGTETKARVVNSGGAQFASHAAGLSFVPRDNYFAKLHKGEQVLTATERKEYNSGNRAQTSSSGYSKPTKASYELNFGDIHLHDVGGDLEQAAEKFMDIIANKIERSGEAGAQWR